MTKKKREEKEKEICEGLRGQIDRIMGVLRFMALTHPNLIVICINNYFKNLPSAYGIERTAAVRLQFIQKRGSEIVTVELIKPPRALKYVDLVYEGARLANPHSK